jgi:hypothetical protein
MRQTKSKGKTSELSDLLKIAALAMLVFACFALDSAAQQKRSENIFIAGRSEQSCRGRTTEQR